MKRRMTMTTAVIGIAMAALAACGSDAGSDGAASPTTAPSAAPSATISEAPPVDNENPDAVALRGDWQIPDEDYVLHLIEDGTFIEDFQGVLDFRTGKYSVDGDTISLIGDDGNTDRGTIDGDTLTFTLGTATRLE